jgi:hypothetical protein
MLRVNTKPRKRNSPRIAEKSAPAFLQWIRGRNCYAGLGREHTCSGKIQAAHVDYAGGKGMATKVADRHCVPLCEGHHVEQHRLGWQSFEVKYNTNCLMAAETYWRNWPGRAAWERKLSDG